MNNDLSEKIISLIISKYPNPVSNTIISSRLQEFDESEIKKALDRLVELGQLKKEEEARDTIVINSYYQMPGDPNYPIKSFIKFGKHSIPRLLRFGNPKYLPENFNEAVELLAAHSDSLVQNYEKRIEDLKSDFWSKIFTTFATFISILALILTGIPKIQIQEKWTYLEVFTYNAAQLLPIFIFSVALIIVTRKITKE